MACAVSCGHSGLIGKEAYVIDPRSLRSDRLVTYDYADGGSYSFYDVEDYLRLRHARISAVTRNYYRNAVDAGKRPFLFHCITHVMYQMRNFRRRAVNSTSARLEALKIYAPVNEITGFRIPNYFFSGWKSRWVVSAKRSEACTYRVVVSRDS